MSSDSELMVDELYKANIERDLGLTVKNNGIWVRCCYHSGGREKTPSLRITVDETSGFFAKGICYGCGAKPHYNDLAKLWGMEKLDVNFKAIGNRKLSFREKLERRNSSREKEIKHETYVPSTFDWEPTRDWRGIPGQIVVDEGAVLGQTRDPLEEPRLIFPVKMYGETKGYIYAMISDPRRDADGKKIDKSYINSSGPWRNSSFFGFDTARKALKRYPNKPLWITEGPRDKLHTQAAGCIVIANLGSSFSAEKAELIKLLNPQRLLIASDADAAGDHLAEEIYDSLLGHVPMTKINWPKGKDPCDIPRERLAAIDKRFTKLVLKAHLRNDTRSNRR